MKPVTRILESIAAGDAKAADELLPLVYEELRKLAAHKMANERPGQTLQATALVHEAWLRLTGKENIQWAGRTHFFAASAEAMRRILIDNARRKNAQRHGSGHKPVNIDDVEPAAAQADDQMLAVHEALDKLAAQDKPKAELVKLRYFLGMTIEESAEILGVSAPTAKRWWAYARAWLYREIRRERSANVPIKS
jgi:RNA polymerase sigma factor (TIGR02999 family)